MESVAPDVKNNQAMRGHQQHIEQAFQSASAVADAIHSPPQNLEWQLFLIEYQRIIT